MILWPNIILGADPTKRVVRLSHGHGVLPITIEDGSFGDIHQIWINRSDETILCFIFGKLPISSGSDEMKITDLPAEKLWFLIGIIVGAAIHGPVTVMVGL